VQRTGIEFDITPSQSPKLAGSKPSEDGRDDEGSISAAGSGYDVPDVSRRRNVHTDPKATSPAALSISSTPIAPISHDISCNEAPLLGDGTHATETADHLADHGLAAAAIAKPVFELTDHWQRELAEQDVAHHGHNVEAKVLLVLDDGRDFEVGGLCAFDPPGGGVDQRNAGAVGDVQTFAHLDAGGRRESFGVLPRCELLGAAPAPAVSVIDLPRSLGCVYAFTF
jgi:hypothetical protein